MPCSGLAPRGNERRGGQAERGMGPRPPRDLAEEEVAFRDSNTVTKADFRRLLPPILNFSAVKKIIWLTTFHRISPHVSAR